MAEKSLNKVQIIGRLGKDPELRYTSNGLAVATMNIATTDRWKPQGSEEWKEETEWHRVVAWGKQAEVAGEYLAKGRQVYIEGRLQTRSWEDKDRVKRYTTEIVVRDMILLGGRGDGTSQNRPPHPADTYESTAVVSPGNEIAEEQGPPMGPPDDIPF